MLEKSISETFEKTLMDTGRESNARVFWFWLGLIFASIFLSAAIGGSITDEYGVSVLNYTVVEGREETPTQTAAPAEAYRWRKEDWVSEGRIIAPDHLVPTIVAMKNWSGISLVAYLFYTLVLAVWFVNSDKVLMEWNKIAFEVAEGASNASKQSYGERKIELRRESNAAFAAAMLTYGTCWLVMLIFSPFFFLAYLIRLFGKGKK